MRVFDYDNLILGEKVFGMEIVDNVVKVLELKKTGGKFTVVGLGQSDVDPAAFSNGIIKNPEVVALAIKQARDQARPHKVRSRYASVYLPDSKIFVRVVKFPSKMNKEEIREAVEWKAKDLIALPIDKVYWDWHRLTESADGGEVEVIISSVEKECADSYTETLRLLNIIPLYYDISGNAAARFLFQDEYKNKKALLVRIDKNSTTLSLFLDGGVRYQTIVTDPTRGGYNEFVRIGVEKLKAEEHEAERLVLYPKNLNNEQKDLLRDPLEEKFGGHIREIKQILEYYDKTLSTSGKKEKGANDLDGIFLFGRGAKTFHLEEAFYKNDLPIKTKINSSSSLSPIVQFVSRQSLIENLSILGLSLRNLGLFRDLRDINLVPNVIKKKYLQRSVYSSLYSNLRIIFWCTLLIVITVGASLVMSLVYKTNLSQELKSVKNIAESSANKQLQDEINALNTTASQISLLLDTQKDWDIFFREVTSRKGAGITYSNILVTEDENIWKAISGEKRVTIKDGQVFLVISGLARTREDLQVYTKYMEESELFDNVKIPISNLEESTNIEFTVYCLLNTNELNVTNN